MIDLSDRRQLTLYDAAYLDLALRTGGRLGTRDKALASAARERGVTLVSSGAI